MADVVIEGRDIGTVVAPDAEVKIYLNADLDRARATPAGRSGRTSAATRSRPTCGSATRATPRACSRPPTRSEIDTTDLEVDDVVDPDRAARAAAARQRRAMNRTQIAQVCAGGRSSPARCGSSRRSRVYGRDRIPANGAVVLCFNHFSWLDPWAIGSLRAAHALLRREAGGARQSVHRPVHPHVRHDLRCAAVSRTAKRCGIMREIVHRGDALGMFPKARGRSCEPGPVHARRRDDRRAGRSAGRLRRHPRHAVLEARATSIRSRSPSASRWTSVSHPRNSKGVPRGSGRHPARAATAVGVSRHDARAGPAARARSPPAMSETEREPLHGTVAIVGFPNVGKSTLDQPAHRVARGGRPRDARA